MRECRYGGFVVAVVVAVGEMDRQGAGGDWFKNGEIRKGNGLNWGKKRGGRGSWLAGENCKRMMDGGRPE
jgi:hypothetical protein